MTDIIFGDRAKKLFEWSRYRLVKEYDIDSEASIPLKYISNIVDIACDHIRPGHTRQRTLDYKDIVIWAVMQKHMGAAVVYDTLYRIGNDELKASITSDMRIPKKLKWTDKALKKLVFYIVKKMYDDKYCNPRVVHADLLCSGNKPICYLHRTLLKVLKEHGYEDMTEILEFFLWVLAKDTGYRDQFFWILDKIGNPTLCDIVHEYVKPPSKWAPNAWLTSKDTTAEEHESNRLPKTKLAYCEEVNVIGFEKKQLEAILGEKIDR